MTTNTIPVATLERRSAAFAQMQELIAKAETEKRDLNESELAEFNRHERQLKVINAEIETIGTNNRAGYRPAPDADTRGNESTPADGEGDAPEVRAAFNTYLRSGDETEIRAMGVATGSAGGYAVPAGFLGKVTETMKAFGGLRRLAEIVPTQSGESLPWPTNDDTANVGEILPEGDTANETDLTLGEKNLGAYTYSSDMVKVSMQLLQDAGFDLDSFVARKLGERIARKQSANWITGTASNQPQGILAGGTVGKTAASATALTYNELVDLTASVDPAYLEGPGVAWVMNSLTWSAIRKLKDLQDRPLVETNLQTGRPTNLLGYQVVIDQAMPTMATTNKAIAFGNFNAGYVIRDVRSVVVLRLVERYADALQVGFLGWQRADGLVQDASAFKLLAMG